MIRHVVGASPNFLRSTREKSSSQNFVFGVNWRAAVFAALTIPRLLANPGVISDASLGNHLFAGSPTSSGRVFGELSRRGEILRDYFSIFASNSTNFRLRSAWSLPDSASVICVMFMEQNFGPHMEQNFASL